MRSFWTLALAATICGVASQSPAAIIDVLRYRLGEAGSFSGSLPLDTVGGYDMTNAFGGFTPGGVTSTMYQPYSTNATAFGPSSSGAYGADSTGLPADNFAVEIWARVSDVNQTFNNYFVLNGNTVGSVSFHAGSGVWAASYFNVAWVGAAAGAGQTATANAWTNLAIIRSNGTSTFYINGVAQAGTTLAAPSYGVATAGIHLAVTPGNTSHFVGDLDEARIFTFDPNVDDPVAALSFNAIPEPSSLALLAFGAISMFLFRRNKR